MNRNIKVLIFVGVLLIIAVILYFGRSKSSMGQPENNFAVEDTAAITKIFLADKSNNTILLQRDSINGWTVNEKYPAGKEVMDLFLETIHRIVPRAPVHKNGQDEIIRQLAATAVKVEIYQEVYRVNLFDKIKLFPTEKAVRIYYVGGPTPNSMGSFMKLEEEDTPFIVNILGFRGYVSTRYSPYLKDWRSHEIFCTPINKIQSIRVEIPDQPMESFEVKKVGEDFSIYPLHNEVPLNKYDTLKLFNFVTAFNSLRFETLKNNLPEKDSIINTSPIFILKLIDTDQEETVMKAFHKPNIEKLADLEGRFFPVDINRLYAMINEDKDFVLIQYFAFDKVLQPLSYYKIPEN